MERGIKGLGLLLFSLLSLSGFSKELVLHTNDFTGVEFKQEVLLPSESVVIDFSSLPRGLHFTKYSFLTEEVGGRRVAKFFTKDHGISMIALHSILGIPETSSVVSVNIAFSPVRLDSGTVLARFYSVEDVGRSIEIRVENFYVQAIVKGIVFTREGDDVEVILVSDEKIRPKEFCEVSIVFDAVNSRISLYLNGVETDRKIFRSASFNFSASESVIEFFPSFFGYVRSIVIAPTLVKSFLSTETSRTQGSFFTELVSKVIDTKSFSTKIGNIRVLGKGEYIVLGKLSSDLDGLLRGSVPWVSLEELKLTKGRYLQLKVIPVLEATEKVEFLGVKVETHDDIPPQKPTIVSSELRKDGEVTIYWKNDLDDEVEYYELFYGDYRKKYFGSDALNGPSPIRIKKPEKFFPVLSYTIRGLQPNRAYFFSIRSVRRDGTKSEYSDEVEIVPSKGLLEAQ